MNDEIKVIRMICGYCGGDSNKSIMRHGRTLNPDGTDNPAECEQK